MASYRAVCPFCGGKFPVDPIKGLPEVCPLSGCGYRVASDRPDDEITEDQVFTTLYGAEEDTVK